MTDWTKGEPRRRLDRVGKAYDPAFIPTHDLDAPYLPHATVPELAEVRREMAEFRADVQNRLDAIWERYA